MGSPPRSAIQIKVSSGVAHKGWLAIAKLKSLSLFISLLLMLKKAIHNIKMEGWKMKVVFA